MKIGIDWLNERDRGVYTRQGSLRRVTRAVAVGLVGLSISVSAQLVSNLDQSIFGTITIEGANLFSNAFTTGSNPGGYTLDSATIQISGVTGSPGDFVIGLHAADGSDPGASLENLAGADPAAGGNHTFTSAGITLDANTTYHLRMSSPASDSSNRYTTFITGNTGQTSSDGWTIADAGRQSSNSGTSYFSSGLPLKFSIQATPVPEPHEYAMLVGLGLAGFVAARRHMISKALS